MEISVHIPALDRLADALMHFGAQPPMPPVPATPVTPASPAAIPAQPVPVASPVPVSAPVMPVPQPAAQTMPTAGAPQYSQDDLAKACATLVDTNRMADLTGILGQFGVQAITQLPEAQYGAFATKLRELGVLK